MLLFCSCAYLNAAVKCVIIPSVVIPFGLGAVLLFECGEFSKLSHAKTHRMSPSGLLILLVLLVSFRLLDYFHCSVNAIRFICTLQLNIVCKC